MAPRTSQRNPRLNTVRKSLERHREYLALLQGVTEVANESSELQPVLAEVVSMTCESLDWPVGHAYIVEDGELRARGDWYADEDVETDPLEALIDRTESLDSTPGTEQALANAEPVYRPVADVADPQRQHALASLGLSSIFHVPIRSRDAVVAVLEFFAPAVEDNKLADLEPILASISAAVGRVAERETSARQYRELMRAEFDREHAELRAAELQALATKLRQRNEELDQFAYVASHDLRAPLRGIGNLASWIARDLEPHLTPDTRRYLALLENRVQRMEALISALLEYSRVGRNAIPAEDVEVDALVREVIDLLGSRDSVEWIVEPLPRICCQRLLLRQTFHNLMSNALKHASGEDARVRISAEPARVGRVPGWRFAVADNGPGIDPRYHERIWEIFQTLRPRDEVEGAGMGLSLVRKIVETRGGSLGLDSQLGEGATFWFTWPASPVDEQTREQG